MNSAAQDTTILRHHDPSDSILLPKSVAYDINTPDYFKSPITTLVNSVAAAPYLGQLTDLLDAYSTFSERIRSQRTSLVGETSSFHSLHLIREHAPQLVHIFRRDMNRIKNNPLALIQPLISPTHQLSPDELNEVIAEMRDDILTLLQGVLRLLSDIFLFPALSSLFTADCVSNILRDLLYLISDHSLPVRLPPKSRNFIIWIFQKQRLSYATISPTKGDLGRVLKSILTDSKSPVRLKITVFTTIHILLNRHRSLLFLCFLQVFPHVLEHILSDDPNVRVSSSEALGSFALAKLHSHQEYLSNDIYAIIRSWITSKCGWKDSKVPVVPLLSLIEEAFVSASIPGHLAKSPPWVLSILASLIVLSDSTLFDHAPSIKFFMTSLSYSEKRVDNDVYIWHKHVWRCLVWAYSRLPLYCDTKVRKQRSTELLLRDGRKLVQEYLGGNMCIAIAVALQAHEAYYTKNGDSTDFTMDNLFQFIQATLQSKTVVSREEGIRLLSWLADKSSEVMPLKENALFLSDQLFDGTLLHYCTGDTAADRLTLLHASSLSPLGDVHIAKYWHRLIDLWVIAANVALEKNTLIKTVLKLWRTLVAGVNPTEEHRNLTFTDEQARQLGNVIANFSSTAAPGPRRLEFMLTLWDTIKRSVQTDCLILPAEIILKSMCSDAFDFTVDNVLRPWLVLYAEVSLPVSVQHIMDIVVELMVDQRTQGTIITRKLWRHVVRKLVRSDENLSASESSLRFICMPLGDWMLSEDEADMYKSLLDAVSTEKGSLREFPWSLQTIFNRIGPIMTPRLSLFPSQTLALLSSIDLEPSLLLVGPVLGALLESLYPFSPKSELMAFDALRLAITVFSKCTVTSIVPVLEELQDGCYKWLRDSSRIITDFDYNNKVIPIYRQALEKLALLPPSGEVLSSITQFLTVVFDNHPTPALGPLRFVDFWTRTYMNAPQLRNIYSDHLRTCLYSWMTLTGTQLAELSPLEDPFATDEIVPESQYSVPKETTDSSRENHTGEERSLYEKSMTVFRLRDYASSGVSSQLSDYDSIAQGAQLSNKRHVTRSGSEGPVPKRRRLTPPPSNPSYTSSRKKKSKLIFDGVVLPRRSRSRAQQASHTPPRPSRQMLRQSSGSIIPETPPMEDYDQWEVGLDEPSLRGANEEDSSDTNDSNILAHILAPAVTGDDLACPSSLSCAQGAGTSTRIETLRNVCDALYTEGSQISGNEVQEGLKMVMNLKDRFEGMVGRMSEKTS